LDGTKEKASKELLAFSLAATKPIKSQNLKNAKITALFSIEDNICMGFK